MGQGQIGGAVDTELTGRQQAQLDALADVTGHRDSDHAAAAVLGRSVRDVRNDGLTDGEADTVIGALREALEREHGMGATELSDPENRWALGSSGLAAGAWMWAGSGIGTWLLTGFAALLCAGKAADVYVVWRDRLLLRK